MFTSNEDLLGALTLAFSMEKGSNEFYKKAEEKIIDRKGKEMFRRLASFKEGHMRYIQYLYTSLLGEKKPITLAEFKEKVPTDIMEGGIKIDPSLANVEDTPFMDDIDVLNTAGDKEAKSYTFYQKLIRKSSDTNSKVIFEELAKEEKKHIKYIKELIDKIK
jgi:rubrerythrin